MADEPARDAVTVTRVRFERASGQLAIGTPTPSISWITETSIRDWRQAAYEIDVVAHDGAPVWSSGRVASD